MSPNFFYRFMVSFLNKKKAFGIQFRMEFTVKLQDNQVGVLQALYFQVPYNYWLIFQDLFHKKH